MILKQFSDLYDAVSRRTKYSPIEVKRCIVEIFRILKEELSTYPKYPAILLNGLVNIGIKPYSLKNMIEKRIMSDEQRAKWQQVLEMVNNYIETRKVKKDVGQEIPEQELPDGGDYNTRDEDNWEQS